MTTFEPFLDADRIVRLHHEGIEKYGGMANAGKPGCVDSSLNAAVNAGLYEGPAEFDDEDPEPDGIIFGASLMFYLVNNHCFGDGNKRTGWAALIDSLATYGLTINASEDESHGFVNSIASGQIDRHGAVAWVHARVVAITPV